MIQSKATIGSIIFTVFNYAINITFALVCIFPFYYIFINSISDNDLVVKGAILLLPKGIHFNNYIEIFKIRGLSNAVFISLARTILGTVLTVISTSFVAFAVNRPELWARKICYGFFIITMYFNVGILPFFINMRNLGLTNNFLAYIIFIISPFSLILVKTYIESLPPSLSESAEIDGAGYIMIFTQIILPVSMPIIATIAVFRAVEHWNSFMDTVLLMSNNKLFTLQYVLYQFLNEANAIAAALRNGLGMTVSPAQRLTTTAIKMTITIVVVMPILFVYPFFQRYFLKGIILGAVKG